MKIFKTDSVAITTFQSHLNNWEIEKLKNWELDHPSTVLHPGLDRPSSDCRYHIQPSYIRQISTPKSQIKTSEQLLTTSRDPFHDASAPPVVKDNANRSVKVPACIGPHSNEACQACRSRFHRFSIASAACHKYIIQSKDTLSNLPSYNNSNLVSNQKVQHDSTLDLPPSYSETIGKTTSGQEFSDDKKRAAITEANKRWHKSMYHYHLSMYYYGKCLEKLN